MLFLQLNILSPHSGENSEYPGLGSQAVKGITSRNRIPKPFIGLLLLRLSDHLAVKKVYLLTVKSFRF